MMRLEKLPSSNYGPERIICRDNQNSELATIYCDQKIRFSTQEQLSIVEIDQIKAVAQNFKLFYNNIA